MSTGRVTSSRHDARRDHAGLTLEPTWRDRASLDDHFRRHGEEIGARTTEQYTRMALDTIRDGIRFTFRRTGEIRAGYYHRPTHRFVVMAPDSNTILSLSRRSENHVRTLNGSTYTAERRDA
jgi:pyocin large subunit-like protein